MLTAARMTVLMMHVLLTRLIGCGVLRCEDRSRRVSHCGMNHRHRTRSFALTSIA